MEHNKNVMPDGPIGPNGVLGPLGIPPYSDVIVLNTTLLRERSKLTSYKECKEINLFERLKAANATAWCKGAGLAAIQIGIPLRAAWYVIGDKEYCLINPHIIRARGKVITKEGCLSIPNVWVQTERYGSLLIASETEGGITETRAVKDFEALIVQHELDHMDGILLYQHKAKAVVDTGRNEPCPCGSGKKYKRCCIDKPPEIMPE